MENPEQMKVQEHCVKSEKEPSVIGPGERQRGHGCDVADRNTMEASLIWGEKEGLHLIHAEPSSVGESSKKNHGIFQTDFFIDI